MTASSVIKDVVLPIACAAVTLGCAGITVLLFSKGEIGGALSTLVLTVMSSLFVINDVKRLFLLKK